MSIRSIYVNVRKNWSLSPDLWNEVFEKLELDMKDIINDMNNINLSNNTLLKTNQDINEVIMSNPNRNKLI